MNEIESPLMEKAVDGHLDAIKQLYGNTIFFNALGTVDEALNDPQHEECRYPLKVLELDQTAEMKEEGQRAFGLYFESGELSVHVCTIPQTTSEESAGEADALFIAALPAVMPLLFQSIRNLTTEIEAMQEAVVSAFVMAGELQQMPETDLDASQIRSLILSIAAGRLALAKLAAVSPQFFNPLEAAAAKDLRDRLLGANNKISAERPTEIASKDHKSSESNGDYCQRIARTLDKDQLISCLLNHINRIKRPKSAELWPEVKQATSHGSGVSQAIVERYFEQPLRDGKQPHHE